MSDIGDRIRASRENRGLSRRAFGDLVGLTEAKVQAVEIGKQRVDHETLASLTELLAIDANWLLLGRSANSVSAPQTSGVDASMVMPRGEESVYVPRFSVEVSAGHGSDTASEDTTGFYAFNRKWLARRGLSPSNLAVVAVRGDSMEPRLTSGDLILVDRSQREIADGLAYVMRIDNDLLVKNVQRIRTGVIVLLSANTFYPPHEVALSDFEGQIEVIGRVVASMHEW